MIQASLSEIKKEIETYSKDELSSVFMRVLKYKQDNKELAAYLLFHSRDEEAFIDLIYTQTDQLFESLNDHSTYLLLKQLRKILRQLQKPIRYSGNPETHAHILIHFCKRFKAILELREPSITLSTLYFRQLLIIEKQINKLHEDLRFDFRRDLEFLNDMPEDLLSSLQTFNLAKNRGI